MRRSHAYLLIAVLVLGVGGFVALVVVQLTLTPQSLAPFCAAGFLIGAFYIWEIVMKPGDMRQEAWDNLRGKKRGPGLTARKVPRAPPEGGQDARGVDPGIAPEVRKDE